MNDFLIFNYKFNNVKFITKYDIYLNIELTHNCNFDCWYCYDKENKHKNINIDINKLTILFELFKYTDKTIHIDLLGGEPTLHPDFLTILQILNKYDNIKKVRITTNGSYKFYYKIKDYIKKDVIILYSHHNNKNFKNILINFKKYNLQFACAFMLDDKRNILELKEEYKIISKLCSTKIHPIYFHKYNEEYLEFFEKNKTAFKRILYLDEKKIILESEYFNEVYNPFFNILCNSMSSRFLFDSYGILSFVCNEDIKFNISNINIKKFLYFLNSCNELKCKKDNCNCWLNYVRNTV